jgi:hypothetical protein
MFSISLFANDKGKDLAKVSLIRLLNSLVSEDGYSYRIQTCSKYKNNLIDSSKPNLERSNAVYYFSRSKHLSYYNSTERIFLSCKLGYFNCDLSKHIISYCLFKDDSAYQMYLSKFKNSDLLNNIDSVFFDESNISLKKTKSNFSCYKITYHKISNEDNIQILYNTKSNFLVSINYCITQLLESGKLIKHKVILDHYSKQEPKELQPLLLSIGDDLYDYLQHHYLDYILVNTNGI